MRTVSNAAERWVVVVARFTDTPQTSAGADDTFVFRQVDPGWPLGDRWEGDGEIDTYFAAAPVAAPAAFGFRTPTADVRLFASDAPRPDAPGTTLVMSFRGYSRSRPNAATFDDAERAAVADATNARPNAGRVTIDAGAVRNPPMGPVRKIHDVAPVWPDAARQANVRGTVIVEFTIAPDGSVTDAHILRGIPLLNDAALECVRQWRYEPPRLDGRPFPAHITATVSFP
jgi:TonB family protein